MLSDDKQSLQHKTMSKGIHDTLSFHDNRKQHMPEYSSGQVN